MRSPLLRFSLLPLCCGLLLSTVNLSNPSEFGSPAMARSTGGRSGGGSFRRAPRPRSQPRSPSGGGFSSPRRSTPRFNAPRRRSTGGGGPIFVPVPSQPRRRTYDPNYQSPAPRPSQPTPTQSGNAGNALLSTLVVLLIGGAGVGLLMWFLLKNRGPASPIDEINNDIVSVSKLQVALVANAGNLQQELSTLASQANTNSNDGLCVLLQEAALLLLRHSESWTHVYSESQTVPNLDIAQKVFNQLTISERSKLSAETLVNVGGRVAQKAVPTPSDDEGPAAYIVVTLLIGTAHDKPLFAEVRDEVALQQTLQDIASMTSDYLFTIELIWSPQDASDSLTYDELLSEYSELLQI